MLKLSEIKDQIQIARKVLRKKHIDLYFNGDSDKDPTSFKGDILLIGIDPEESGGYFINHNGKNYKCRADFDSLQQRANTFIYDLNQLVGDVYYVQIYYVIEKVWGLPRMNTKAMTSLTTSYGHWLGVLNTLHNIMSCNYGWYFDTNFISPKKWKGEFELTSDKKDSIKLAFQMCDLIRPKSLLRKQPRDSAKSVGDKCEAFLLHVMAFNKLAVRINNMEKTKTRKNQDVPKDK